MLTALPYSTPKLLLPGTTVTPKKYEIDELPTFVSAHEVVREMNKPLGPEWNSTESVKEHTRAPVHTRAGVVITPIRMTKALEAQVDAYQARKKARLERKEGTSTKQTENKQNRRNQQQGKGKNKGRTNKRRS